MIELRVAKYCNNCDEFEPDVDKTYTFGSGAYTTISCVHERRCYEMIQHLKKELKKENEDA